MAKELVMVKADKNYKKHVFDTIENFNTNGKKTVVLVCDSYFPVIDGVVKVVDNYTKLLSDVYNVILIVPRHRNKVLVEENILIIGVKGIYIGFLHYDMALPLFDRMLGKYLKNLRIDLIHSHSPFPIGAKLSKVAKKRGIPLATTMHSQYKLDIKKYAKFEFLTKMILSPLVKVFNRSTEVWTMTTKTADTIKDYGYKGDIFYMPNATDDIEPKNLNELRANTRQKLGISNDEKVFIFVGRLVRQKNILFVADALKILKEKGLKFKMIFVGDGPDKGELEKKIIENGLKDNVIYAGFVSDKQILSSYYACSDLLLFPSVYDTWSLVRTEAAAHKVPGVFLKDTLTAATITDKRNGYLSEHNTEKYAELVLDILSDPDSFKKISECAKEELYFTWNDLKPKIIERYDYLIENAKKD